MKKNKLHFFILIFSCLIFICSNSKISISYKDIYNDYQVKGSFILYDLKNNYYYRYNAERCKEKFLPASTFKIFNSLVGLETGVIKDENHILKWDNQKREVPIWNQDHDLKSAFKYSVTWYFSEIARQVGSEKMKYYLDKSLYGNGDISEGIDKFWLSGNFGISQEEQVEFLKKFYFYNLPFSKRSIDIVKNILIYEKGINFCIYAKSGTVASVNPKIGWWVGYIEKNNNVYFFAHNFEKEKIDEKFFKAITEIPKRIFDKIGLYAYQE